MTYKSKIKRLEYGRDYVKKAREKLRKKGLCTNCGKKPLTKGHKTLCVPCNEKHKKDSIIRCRKIRDKVFIHYGNQCVICKENDPVVLTIDHINGDGAAHRRSTIKSAGTGFYKWLIKNDYPNGFRLLCRNCNWRTFHKNNKINSCVIPDAEDVKA